MGVTETMKLRVPLFFAGLFGALATVFVLLSFGTDYWLLVRESCEMDSTEGKNVLMNHYVNAENVSTYYHEGFFWRCSFSSQTEQNSVLMYWLTNQPYTKECMHAYLFPFPISKETHNVTTYDSAIIYRGFWSVFMLLGVTAAVLGGFIIICAAPFSSHCLYKAGGAFYLIAGFFLLAVTVMYVIWLEAMGMVEIYMDYKAQLCSNFNMRFCYGLSFFFAPVGVFFCLLSGLLFFLIGRCMNFGVQKYQARSHPVVIK